MKKVEKLKAGMKVFIAFYIEENDVSDYPFLIRDLGIFTQDCRRFKNEPPVEMFTIDENEIPELKGVEMEVSDNKNLWAKVKIYFKGEDGYFYGYRTRWKFARPIQKTFDLSNVPEHLLTDELKQYLK